MKFRAVVSAAIALVGVLVLSGCSPTAPESEKPQVVASLSVWGNLATYIGGDKIDVTNLINSSSQDPHSYEASARDQLALSKADLVLANGGGFDPFIDQLLAASDKKPNLLKVENLALAIDFASNEHAWYSLPTVQIVATEIAAELKKIDSANAEFYQAGLDSVMTELAATATKAATLAEQTSGKTAITTEPLVDYLLTDLGITSKTPTSFAEAIEEERDASVADLEAVAALIRDRQVDMLVVNSSTVTGQIEYLVGEAEKADIPIFEFAELPEQGESYSSWLDFYLETMDAFFE